MSAEKRVQLRIHEDHVAPLADLLKRGLAAAEADPSVGAIETLDLWDAADAFDRAAGIQPEPIAPVIDLAMERRRRRGTTHPAGDRA